MEDLILFNKKNDILQIYQGCDSQWIQIFDGEDAFYKLNKDQAKQIVEHLTKVFEL